MDEMRVDAEILDKQKEQELQQFNYQEKLEYFKVRIMFLEKELKQYESYKKNETSTKQELHQRSDSNKQLDDQIVKCNTEIPQLKYDIDQILKKIRKLE